MQAVHEANTCKFSLVVSGMAWLSSPQSRGAGACFGLDLPPPPRANCVEGTEGPTLR